MEHKTQQGMEEFKVKAKEVDQQGLPCEISIELLRACANQQCVLGLHTLPGCVELRETCRDLLQVIGPAMATYQAW